MNSVVYDESRTRVCFDDIVLSREEYCSRALFLCTQGYQLFQLFVSYE